ncbi:unnamed protein product, partial [Callosobruchus maculatus]
MQTISLCWPVILALVYTLDIGSCTPVDSRLYRISKHHLLERELEYLQNQPLSEDLQAFIKRIKRSKEESRTNNKREDDENVIVSDDDDMCKDITTTPSSLSCSTSNAVETTTSLNTTATSISTTTNTPTTTLATTTSTTSTTANETEDELERGGPKLEPQILTKVVDDVQELLKIQQEDIAKGPESSMCNVTGD